jgi:uncharacterized protein YbaA (DUF1428 family)
MENDNGELIQVFVWRTPKKNHEAMMQLNEPAKEMFRKVGLRREIFLLSDDRDSEAENMGFIDLAKTVSAKEDEEVWLELQFYRDSKHHVEVGENMRNNKSAMELGGKFMELITPGSCVIAKFNHLKT